ncbi:cytochrome c3 family protein [Thermodesulfobacteriota bacterium]
MRKTAGFLLVFLFATLLIVTSSNMSVSAPGGNGKGKDTSESVSASGVVAMGDTSNSHPAHLTAAYGPLIASCDVCHVESYAGVFTDSQDLANTTVCNPCHSPGGAYDGVNDPNIGAKTNWVYGVYNGSALQAGKEKWCVGCHDDDPSVVNGVSAPNIAGDDVDYGYYMTGHGKHGYEKAIGCLDCHDPAFTHVDGAARTYAAVYDNYQAGYRLKSVGGLAPLDVPRSGRAFTADQFRLCFSCHESTPFLNSNNTDTNFRSDVNDSCGAPDPLLVNKHWYHLLGTPAFRNKWDSDFDRVAADSMLSCPACHNVHGPRLKDGATHAPAMIRTGELIDRETSLDLDYFTSECNTKTLSPTNELFDATNGDSTGGSMKSYGVGQGTFQRNGVCTMCHMEAEPYWREAKDILSCVNCHGDLQANHTATPGSDYVLVFAAGQHDSSMVGDGEIYIACTNCHATNLGNIHDNNCAACHAGSPSPKESLGESWAGGCQQGACHTAYHEDASDKHNEVTDYEEESNCTDCHGEYWQDFPPLPSSCSNCHAAYSPSDTTPPETTSDVQPSYIGSAVIEFSMTDNGGKVGIGTFYSQIDGEAPEIGSSIFVDTVGSHTLEFWGVDQVGNEELPHNTATFEITADTTPPVTTSNVQEGRNYETNVNVIFTATDNGPLGAKTTYYTVAVNPEPGDPEPPTQTGNSYYIAKQPGTINYTINFWSEDWSGNVEPINTVNFTVTGGSGTLRLVWWDSDTNPGHAPDCDFGDWASWTIRRGGWSGTVVATGSGDACQGWNGIDDISVPVSTQGYYTRIDWNSDGWSDQTDFPNIIIDTPGETITLHY